MSRRALAAWLCVAALAHALPALGGELERKRDDARRRQSEVRGQLDLARASEAELTRRVSELDQEVARRRADAEAAQADAGDAAVAVSRITQDVEGLRARVVHRRQVFNRRAVTAYMEGEGRPLEGLAMIGELLAMPKDLADAGRRAELVSRVAHQDVDVLGELTAAHARLATEELALVLAQNRAATRAAEAASGFRTVAALRAEQEATRAALAQRIVELQAALDAMAAEQARLETLIRERLAAAVKARAARSSPFAGRRTTTAAGGSASGFVWPVQGYISSEYGPRWGRMHTGIDIAAPSGTPIGAAKAGEVIYADQLGAYGNLVAVDHGDSVVTLYAHQSRIAVAEGQEVSQGQTVGYVGSTGRSTGNHLHLEVRIDAQPRNPRPYLP